MNSVIDREGRTVRQWREKGSMRFRMNWRSREDEEESGEKSCS